MALPQPYIDRDTYVAQERDAEFRSEYFDGTVVAMAGASFRHSMLVGNLLAALASPLRSRGCSVHASDLRVFIAAANSFTYPDLVIVCGEPSFTGDQPDTVTNPTAIVEVLSPSTEALDRGGKFIRYQTLPSLEEYILIAQDDQRVEHYKRRSDQRWLLTVIEDDASVDILDVEVPLSEIYARP